VPITGEESRLYTAQHLARRGAATSRPAAAAPWRRHRLAATQAATRRRQRMTQTARIAPRAALMAQEKSMRMRQKMCSGGSGKCGLALLRCMRSVRRVIHTSPEAASCSVCLQVDSKAGNAKCRWEAWACSAALYARRQVCDSGAAYCMVRSHCASSSSHAYPALVQGTHLRRGCRHWRRRWQR
jgi:hypothetical protein